MKTVFRLLFTGIIVTCAAVASATPTHVTVRVISKDAKFIGTSMGGMLITLRDAQTSELLTQGVTAGGTGDTKRIMTKDRRRGEALSTDDVAKFTSTLDLTEPRLVEVTAFGPLAQRQSAVSVSATQWLVPGKHVTGGDGWVLEVPGMVVDVLAPPAHLKITQVPARIEVNANVTMMCGCPIEPDGIWDAKRLEVKGLLKRNGETAGELAMAYAGTTSQFSGALTVNQPGAYDIIVYAYDVANGNTGLDRTSFVVELPALKKP